MKKYTLKYPKIHSFLWDEDYLSYRFWVISILGLIIITPIILYFDKKETIAYQKTQITFGIVDKVHNKPKFRYIDFHFWNKKGKKVEVKTDVYVKQFDLDIQCLNDRKKGDTVIVKYSLIDSSYAKIINCYWNDNIKKEYGFYKWN